MFGTDTDTPKTNTLFETRPLRTIPIAQIMPPNVTKELGTEEPYHESYFWWINPENAVTHEEITPLYRYQYSENLTYHTPCEQENFVWYTQYPLSDQRSSQPFETPEVWGGNKS